MWDGMSSSSRSQNLQKTRKGFFDRTRNSDSTGSFVLEMQLGFPHFRRWTARSGKVHRR